MPHGNGCHNYDAMFARALDDELDQCHSNQSDTTTQPSARSCVLVSATRQDTRIRDTGKIAVAIGIVSAVALGLVTLVVGPSHLRGRVEMSKVDQIISDAAADFSLNRGYNCWEGNGAESIAKNEMLAGLSLEECRSECRRKPECEGIIFLHKVFVGRCWLRKNINIPRCQQGTEWDLWKKNSASGRYNQPVNTQFGKANVQEIRNVQQTDSISFGEESEHTYDLHHGYNCWSGHGAEPLQERADYHNIELEHCKVQCDKEPHCRGLIGKPSRKRGSCWLYKNIDLNVCEKHTSWSLWTKTVNSRTPPPTQPPTQPPVPLPAEKPSEAPTFEFYTYRASKTNQLGKYPMGEMNTANIDGLLWYLLNEVTTMYSNGTRCPRKFGISEIHRFKLKLKTTHELFKEGSNFGVRFAYDFGKCKGRCFSENLCTSEQDCVTHYNKYGYVVGCNNFKDRYPFPDFDTSAPGGIWYSLPLAGRCNGPPLGTSGCTWSYEDAGVISLLDLEKSVPGGDNCCDGHCTDFWANPWDPNEMSLRIVKALDVFHGKYPMLPRDLKTPACDFHTDQWYANDEWPRKDPWA